MKRIVQMSYQVCEEDNLRKGLAEEREGFPATDSENSPLTYGFDLVGLSPRLPRFWGRGVQGRPADSLREAEQIAGRPLDMVLVAPLDGILANGTLKTEFAFMTYGAIAFIAGTSLEKIVSPRSLESDRDGRQIHRVTFLPDLDRMDAVWTAPGGHVSRLVQIEKDVVCRDLGDERAFDQDGEDDDQLTVTWTSKLGRQELKALRAAVNER